MTSNHLNILIIVSLCTIINIVIAQPGPPNNNNNNAACGITPVDRIVTATTSGTNRVIRATGCPGYNWTSQSTPNTAKQQNVTYTFPFNPVLSNTKVYVGIKAANNATNTNPVMGSIGVAVNGVAIFGNSDADKRDAYIYESQTFDKCGGHPEMTGAYHYHAEPSIGCVVDSAAGQHSPLFAIMADGIPLYGPYADNGAVPTNLDECGGHVDNTYPFYHYHLPPNRTFPYTITCLRGCIFNSNGNNNLNSYVTTTATCSQASTQYNYSSLSINWITYNTSGNSVSTPAPTAAPSVGSDSETLSQTNMIIIIVAGGGGLLLIAVAYIIYRCRTQHTTKQQSSMASIQLSTAQTV